MTTKQIAQAVNREERTVRNWVTKMAAKISSIKEKNSASTSTNPADYDLDETCAIIETGMGKNAADLYRMNARGVPAHQSGLTEKDVQLISMLTTSIVSQVMANLDQRMHKIEDRIETRQALLPAPQIDSRNHICKMVREYAEAKNIEYREAYRLLYREFGYRTHTDPSRSAKNRNMSIIDYIDAEGQIDTLLSVAIDVMGAA